MSIAKPTEEEAIEALREASISIACLMDENCDDLILGLEIEHIQDQITIVENFYDPVPEGVKTYTVQDWVKDNE
jgi:hypothetical protein|tara:strand:+ start:1925 stop:2146 length:222 start_codon:yes stop_codon:yes gene_type:complete